MGEMLMRNGGGMCESDEKLELGELGCCDALQLRGPASDLAGIGPLDILSGRVPCPAESLGKGIAGLSGRTPIRRTDIPFFWKS